MNAQLAEGQWSHVVGTFDGAAIRIFVNGEQISGEPSAAELADVNEPLRIGQRSAGGETFTGAIDEVAIYKDALDYTQVAAPYEAAER